MSRDARIARAKALELPTPYVAPPGDVMSHHAAALAKIVCSAVFITGFEPAFAVQNVGAIPPFEVRSKLGTPQVDPAEKAVSVLSPSGTTRVARYFEGNGCITYPEGKSQLHFVPKAVKSNLPSADGQPWPMGDLVNRAALTDEIDGNKLRNAMEVAFEPPEAMTAAFVVVWKGNIIAERYAPGITRHTALESWSLGKTVTAIAAGILIDEGTLQLWERAPIAEWHKAPGDMRANIRVADLLRMSSGLRSTGALDAEPPPPGYLDRFYVYTGSSDLAQRAITRPPAWPPGTVGRYRNSDTLVLNRLMQQVLEKRGDEPRAFIQRALFERIGVRTMVLEPDAYGNLLSHGYVLGSARDWARVGMLLLQGGVWNGERILSDSFVRFMTTPAPAWHADGRPWYGGSVWLNRGRLWPTPEDSYVLLGAGDQTVMVLPTHDLVVVRMGHMKGEATNGESYPRALKVLLEAIPQSRPVQKAEAARP